MYIKIVRVNIFNHKNRAVKMNKLNLDKSQTKCHMKNSKLQNNAFSVIPLMYSFKNIQNNILCCLLTFAHRKGIKNKRGAH